MPSFAPHQRTVGHPGWQPNPHTCDPLHGLYPAVSFGPDAPSSASAPEGPGPSISQERAGGLNAPPTPGIPCRGLRVHMPGSCRWRRPKGVPPFHADPPVPSASGPRCAAGRVLRLAVPRSARGARVPGTRAWGGSAERQKRTRLRITIPGRVRLTGGPGPQRSEDRKPTVPVGRCGRGEPLWVGAGGRNLVDRSGGRRQATRGSAGNSRLPY
jgi:hypothetical protein